MAENRQEFLDRIAALADLVSPHSIERAVRGSLRAVKSSMPEERREEFAALLPEWLRSDWEGLEPEGISERPYDLVDLLKAIGEYPYRAAAERDLTAVFAALRESIAEEASQAMRALIPEADREMFDHAASCAYDASVKEFL